MYEGSWRSPRFQGVSRVMRGVSAASQIVAATSRLSGRRQQRRPTLLGQGCGAGMAMWLSTIRVVAVAVAVTVPIAIGLVLAFMTLLVGGMHVVVQPL